MLRFLHRHIHYCVCVSALPNIFHPAVPMLMPALGICSCWHGFLCDGNERKAVTVKNGIVCPRTKGKKRKGKNYQKITLSRRCKEWRGQTTVKVMISSTHDNRIAWCHCISAKDMPNMYLSVSSNSRTDLTI
jgi:hypothetical protein